MSHSRLISASPTSTGTNRWAVAPRWLVFVGVMALAFLLAAFSSPEGSFAKKGGGKGGGGDPPPSDPPPVEYILSWFPSIWGGDSVVHPVDMNDSGTVVGYETTDDLAFVFDPALNPNLPIDPPYSGQLLEVDGLSAQPESARVNDAGQIVIGSGSQLVAPSVIYPDGTYDYVPGVSETFPNHFLVDINSAGQMCGSRIASGKGKNKVQAGTVRLHYENGDEVIIAGGPWARALNDVGDMCFKDGSRSYLYTDENGVLALDDLVVNQDTFWQNDIIIATAINNVDETGYGQICGYATTNSGMGFVLTPVPSEP